MTDDTWETYEELVGRVVTPLVEFPDQLVVTTSSREDVVLIELQVNPSDSGRVIGKGGETIRAIRTLIELSATRRGARAHFELRDG